MLSDALRVGSRMLASGLRAWGVTTLPNGDLVEANGIVRWPNGLVGGTAVNEASASKLCSMCLVVMRLRL